MGHSYGFKRDLPDQRDQFYGTIYGYDLPQKVDLRSFAPPVYDQGGLGSCTAFACMSSLQMAHMLENDIPSLHYSELFHYYNERFMEGTVSVDSGASIRDGFKAMHKFGVVKEDLWPYNIQDFAKQPPKSLYKEAKKDVLKSYQRVFRSANAIKTVLAAKRTVVVGLSIYESFESEAVANTGHVSMPGPNEALLGGHAVCVVGYDMSYPCWIVRNSWSDQWGDNGYFYLPMRYLEKAGLSSDFWTVSTL